MLEWYLAVNGLVRSIRQKAIDARSRLADDDRSGAKLIGGYITADYAQLRKVWSTAGYPENEMGNLGRHIKFGQTNDYDDILAHDLPEVEIAAEAHVRNGTRIGPGIGPIARRGSKIFFGHGRSPVWRELKDFVHDRLKLDWEEFNREAVAGLGTTERLHHMLESAEFAFLLMTAEDELVDGTPQARPNVIHEIGLFQGKLGTRRAIVLLEEGCTEFSNIVGLSQIRFPKGRISACFEEVRQVLDREGIVSRS